MPQLTVLQQQAILIPKMVRAYRSPSAPSIKERSFTAISLLLLVGLFSAAGVIMGYYFLGNPDLLFSDNPDAKPTKTATHVEFENGEFFIPRYLLSSIKRTTLRKTKTINLAIPVNWTKDHPPVSFSNSTDLSQWILAAIEKRKSAVDHSDRLTKIYRHYVAGPAVSHSSGLFRYYFKPESPYAGIELFTDNLQTPNLIIRCEVQSSTLGTRLCSRQMPVSSRLSMLYKFPRAHIDNWQQVHKTMQLLLTEIFRRKGV